MDYEHLRELKKDLKEKEEAYENNSELRKQL